jgi:hypothetical protein
MAEINRILPGRADAFDERVHSLGGDYRETAWVHAMSSSRACVMLTVSLFGL